MDLRKIVDLTRMLWPRDTVICVGTPPTLDSSRISIGRCLQIISWNARMLSTTQYTANCLRFSGSPDSHMGVICEKCTSSLPTLR